jgi:myosin-light-chain kinase
MSSRVTDLEERKKERAPEFLSNFNDSLVMEGSEAKLSLRFVGYPAPEITWLFNGQVVEKTGYYDITQDEEEACLYVRIARPEHTGQYTCRLKNKFGLAEVTAQLSVAVKPQLEGRLTDQEILLGSESRFTCKYKAFPLPSVTWYHNKLVLTVSFKQ